MINLRFKWLQKGEQIQPGKDEQLLIFHAQRLGCIFNDEGIPIINIGSGINDIITFGTKSTKKLKKEYYIATDEITLALIVESKVKLEHEFFAVNYDKIHIAGEPYYKGNPQHGDSRRVWQFIGPDSGLPFRLGLTVHSARGTWSSTPHKFEIDALTNPATIDFYEEFAYMTNPKGGWGIQVKMGHMGEYRDFVKYPQFIADRSIEQIPLGAHPVTGGPGVQLAYFWVYTASDLGLMEKFE